MGVNHPKHSSRDIFTDLTKKKHWNERGNYAITNTWMTFIIFYHKKLKRTRLTYTLTYYTDI
jgi:hypothetical protein